jgi:hypothetical protein
MEESKREDRKSPADLEVDGREKKSQYSELK